MRNFTRWLTARLAEPSSAASLGALGALNMPNMPDGPVGWMVLGAVYLLIAFGVISPEGNSHTE